MLWHEAIEAYWHCLPGIRQRGLLSLAMQLENCNVAVAHLADVPVTAAEQVAQGRREQAHTGTSCKHMHRPPRGGPSYILYCQERPREVGLQAAGRMGDPAHAHHVLKACMQMTSQ